MNGDKHNGSNDGSDSGKADPAWTTAQLRAACGSGAYRGHTSGLADRHAQGNVVILPQALAADFLLLC